MSTKKYKRAILIGRYQPAHNGHFRNFSYAADLASTVHVLIGSAFQPRTPKNPFIAEERQMMIASSLREIPNSVLNHYNILFAPVRDFDYSNNLWIREVQRIEKELSPNVDDSEIVLLGYEKDNTSWYLRRAFPNWLFIPLDGYVEHGYHPIDATKIRELYFEGHLDYIKGAVPPSVFDFLKTFSHTSEYGLLVEEYQYVKKYKKDWEVAPYPPTFFTVDAVVIQGGHILLVKRKFAPGKGLWALPGGFLGQNETTREAVIRELREETGLKVPEPVLNGSITFEKLFDKPDRSLRGRTLTQAYLVELTGGDSKLPRVRGQDDALVADWFTIDEALKMTDKIFEDHSSIIQTMIGRSQ